MCTQCPVLILDSVKVSRMRTPGGICCHRGVCGLSSLPSINYLTTTITHTPSTQFALERGPIIATDVLECLEFIDPLIRGNNPFPASSDPSDGEVTTAQRATGVCGVCFANNVRKGWVDWGFNKTLQYLLRLSGAKIPGRTTRNKRGRRAKGRVVQEKAFWLINCSIYWFMLKSFVVSHLAYDNYSVKLTLVI